MFFNWLKSLFTFLVDLKLINRSCLFSFAFFYIPLSNPDLWHSFPIGDIPNHSIAFSENKMIVDVKKSSGPIVLPLSQVYNIQAVKIRGHLLGGPLNLKHRRQGYDRKADDFVLRVGLVVPGERSMSFLERQVAPNWVLRLLELAPKDSGIGHIVFLNAVQQTRLLGHERTHPKSDLIKEKFVWLLQENGPFEFEYTFPKNVPTGAIWIAIDGDDTSSDFTLEIEEIIIGAKTT